MVIFSTFTCPPVITWFDTLSGGSALMSGGTAVMSLMTPSQISMSVHVIPRMVVQFGTKAGQIGPNVTNI